MPNKVRCSDCHTYIEKADAIWRGPLRKFCSIDCERHSLTKKVRKPQKQMRSTRHIIDAKLRRRILERDKHQCRHCGTATNLHCHHVFYLSQGIFDHESNLIILCREHHELVHSNKKKYQPILLGVIWSTYSGRHLSVPQFERWFRE